MASRLLALETTLSTNAQTTAPNIDNAIKGK